MLGLVTGKIFRFLEGTDFFREMCREIQSEASHCLISRCVIDRNRCGFDAGAARRAKTTCGLAFSFVNAIRTAICTNRKKEALALTWAAERLKCYVKVLDFQFETDHKPLVTLLGKSPVDALTPRAQKFRLRLMRFSFSIGYVPGKQIVTADTLSLAPRERN